MDRLVHNCHIVGIKGESYKHKVSAAEFPAIVYSKSTCQRANRNGKKVFKAYSDNAPSTEPGRCNQPFRNSSAFARNSQCRLIRQPHRSLRLAEGNVGEQGGGEGEEQDGGRDRTRITPNLIRDRPAVRLAKITSIQVWIWPEMSPKVWV